MDNIITVEGVSKAYKGTKVLDNVNVVFGSGRIHGIIGRNGSGKTMLIKAVCGLVQPDSGKITVSGKVVGQDVDFPENIGVIIESPGFLPSESGYRNLAYLASLRGKIGKSEIRNAIISVGLNPDDKKHVGKYSLGMRQRLGIAQAMMENPDILILDEPMNGLDKSGVEDIRKLLLRFRDEGKTILLVSHSTEDIGILCDEVYEMDNGRLHGL